MADTISKEKRSWNMSRIPGKDTSIEVKVRRFLFARGFRFRKNVKALPGKPDIVLPKYKTIVFIQGCFWHRHEGCKRATFPKSNEVYWKEKFDKNVANDMLHYTMLRELGWRVITVWECEINKSFDATMNRLIEEITAGSSCQ